MIYIFGWALIFFSGLSIYFFGNKLKIFCWMALLAVSAAAIFRGDVGTDTYTYQYIVSELRAGNEIYGWEPAFLVLMKGLAFIFESDAVVVRMFALFYCTLIGVFLYRANFKQAIFLMALLLPQVFFSY